MKKLPARVSKRRTKEPVKAATLRVLKIRGDASVNDLCKALNLTHTAVRRCLSSLQREGIVERRALEHKRGRPSHSYKLTTSSAGYFPNGYEGLAQSVLDTVFQRGGHAAVMELLKANNDRIIASLIPLFQNKTLKERIEALCAYFTANGYMSDWMPVADGNFFLYNQNCAVLNLASQYRQFCILEPRLIESLLEHKITRQQYILKGQAVCGYLIDAQRQV